MLPQSAQKTYKNTIILDPLHCGTEIYMYILYPGNKGYTSEWTIDSNDKCYIQKQTVGLVYNIVKQNLKITEEVV